MGQKRLVAVDGTMSYTDPNLDPSLINAWSNTTMFAQAAARTKSSDTTSDGYFSTMNSELSRLGWNILKSGKVDLDQSSGKMFTPKDIVLNIIGNYVTDGDQTALSKILDAIKSPDAGVSNFVNFWWNRAKTHATQAQFAFGPLAVSNAQPSITVCYYSFNFDASSWRSLFVQQDSAELNVQARYLTMQLNMDMYNRIKDDLISRISGKVKDHIDQTDLDL